jgi:hypothetical protein
MDTDPPIIKEEDLDIDMSLQFSNLPDNPVDLTLDDDDFGSDDDVRVPSPQPDSDDDDSEYGGPSSPDRLHKPPVIVIRDSATPPPHFGDRSPPAPRRIPDEDRAPATPPGLDSDPESNPDNPRLTEGMRIRKQM